MKKIKKYIKKIWKLLFNILKYSVNILQFIRIITINIFFLIFVIIIIGIYFNINYSQPLPEKTALILDITGTITDKPATYDKFQKINQHLFNINKSHHVQENSLFDIINILRQAKNDPNITGLILSLKNFSGCHQSSLEYVGKVLCEFKKSGKKIFAISDHYSQPQYFLASYANKIYLTPQGSVDIKGISTNRLYYKSFLENLKINTHIFRVGKYKSAIEPFARDNMSDDVKQEEKKWINNLWQQYLEKISINRNIDKKQIFPNIQNIIKDLHQLRGNTAHYALKKQWIDEIAPRNIIDDTMKKIFGKNKENTSFNAISMYDYILTEPQKKNDQIAVICINGSIIEGSDISGSVGSDTIIHKIREARFNPNIKAIILRINSPGGGMHASELIRSELTAIQQNSEKPIVVSMSGVAASGGYWISTPANVIIASNSTLTGSIGVFGIINTFEKSLNSIGIYNDGVSTSPIANISITKQLPSEYIDMMQLYVNTNYHYFITTVAQSRKNILNIEKIAQGRIWLGCEAVKNGLIDKIGDFDDAINTAAELAHLKEYQINWYNDQINLIDLLWQKTNNIIYTLVIKLLTHYISIANIQEKIQINHPDHLKFIWNDPKFCYALCLDDIQYH